MEVDIKEKENPIDESKVKFDESNKSETIFSESYNSNNNDYEEEDENANDQMNDLSIEKPTSQLNGNHEDDDESSNNKRKRKKVQRLSETWNRVYESKEKERVKAIKRITESFGGGDGTALGDIPLIEATIRKVKPVELKVLHSIVFGRPGTIGEIRSNLRKFKGFGFQTNSNEYDKKMTYIKQLVYTMLLLLFLIIILLDNLFDLICFFLSSKTTIRLVICFY